MNGDATDPLLEMIKSHDKELGHITGDLGGVKTDLAGVKSDVSNLGSQVQSGFAQINQNLTHLSQPTPAPPYLQIASFGVSLVVILGMVLGFLFHNITGAQQRETDTGFKAVAKSLSAIERRMSEDDERERLNAYDQGRHDAELESLNKWVKNIEQDLKGSYISQQQHLLKLSEQLSANTAEMAMSEKAVQRHLKQQGSAGHPTPERVISQKTPLGVQQK